jgi:alcohol dehydrogenase (cytochrome c)
MTRPSGFICLLSALLPAAGQVTYQDLLKADPGNWLTYSGSYNSQRHSLLKQINAGNAQALTPKWIYHVPGAGRVESVPIVVAGVMYVSQPNEVFALD